MFADVLAHLVQENNKLLSTNHLCLNDLFINWNTVCKITATSEQESAQHQKM